MKILVKAALSEYSGYGRDGVGLIKALVRAGHDVRVLTSEGVTPPVPLEVANCLTKRLDDIYDLTIVHLDPFMSVIEPSLRRVSFKALAWTMWEFESLSLYNEKKVTKKQLRKVRDNLQRFDVVAAYDPTSAQALAPVIPPVGSPMFTILQGGYDPEPWPYMERDWSNTFRFVMVGALSARKNPAIAIRAFQELKEEYGAAFDAELHLKTTGKVPEWWDDIPGVIVINRHWDHDRLLRFYGESHVLLAPSVGEGKNLPALEALTTGMPVIATNWGGHTGWLDDKHSFPLEYTMKRYPNGMGAEASLEHLKFLMLYAYHNRELCKSKGAFGRTRIMHSMSWEMKSQEMLKILEDVPPRRLDYPIGEEDDR